MILDELENEQGDGRIDSPAAHPPEIRKHPPDYRYRGESSCEKQLRTIGTEDTGVTIEPPQPLSFPAPEIQDGGQYVDKESIDHRPDIFLVDGIIGDLRYPPVANVIPRGGRRILLYGTQVVIS